MSFTKDTPLQTVFGVLEGGVSLGFFRSRFGGGGVLTEKFSPEFNQNKKPIDLFFFFSISEQFTTNIPDSGQKMG